jgi:hypothetical protein
MGKEGVMGQEDIRMRDGNMEMGNMGECGDVGGGCEDDMGMGGRKMSMGMRRMGKEKVGKVVGVGNMGMGNMGSGTWDEEDEEDVQWAGDDIMGGIQHYLYSHPSPLLEGQVSSGKTSWYNPMIIAIVDTN